MGSEKLKGFFDPEGIVVVEGLSFSKEGRKSCLKKADGGCKGEGERGARALMRKSRLGANATKLYSFI